jgi:hypothetical protein
MTVFMGSTNIAAAQTVGQIQSLLGAKGASSILMDYEDGEVSALSFKYNVNGVDLPFRLPSRWRELHKTMLAQMAHPRESRMSEYESQAKRVAWRQILRWIEAQLALVETNMVKVEEVFFPYIQDKSGKTIFEKIESNNFMALEWQGK